MRIPNQSVNTICDASISSKTSMAAYGREISPAQGRQTITTLRQLTTLNPLPSNPLGGVNDFAIEERGNKILCCASVNPETGTGTGCAFLAPGKTCYGDMIACTCEVLNSDGSGRCCD
ncbi:hypothetical protein FNW02_11535 [Komarekiella sp. 'clone 1']|uniref:Uncharacterized protein n=1 Tax=Komarekiella delphini-convector SJRDD-AB1 TaxID=2593771 RepID=A0AA40SW84_9NOST|nr:hypothetical protein [Komarekiella delphini-convector]MBD6616451.1 hypothetical protein [Komarekiella delphini-convector SJRDD-AB1]